MSFEGTYFPLSGVAAVEVWRDNMELAGPIVLYSQIVGLVGLVVKDLEVNSVATILKTCHDAVVRRYAVSVVPGLEGFEHNDIGVNMVLLHNVVVATEVADVEAAHVVCVELADGLTEDVELLGFYVRNLTGDVGELFLVGRFGLGGEQTLSGMSHVSFKGPDQDRTVFCHVCINKAYP